MIIQRDPNIWMHIHCPECGSDDMHWVAGVLAECRRCGVGHLGREYNLWESPKDYRVAVNEREYHLWESPKDYQVVGLGPLKVSPVTEITSARAAADRFVVNSPGSVKSATNDLSLIAKLKKALTAVTEYISKLRGSSNI